MPRGAILSPPLSHAQPGGLWHVNRLEMQLFPHALPLLQVLQQLLGAGRSGSRSGAGFWRAGCRGLSGARCAITSASARDVSLPLPAHTINSTTNNVRIPIAR